MELRKPAIAGVAAVAVISVGAFAQAMFSDEGLSGWSRGWEVVEAFIRSPSREQNPEPQQPARFSNWTSPNRAVIHPIGDASSRQPRAPRVNLEALDHLRSTAADPMVFGAWQDDADTKDAEAVLGLIDDLSPAAGLENGRDPRRSQARTRSMRPGGDQLGLLNDFSVVGDRNTSLNRLAAALVSGSHGDNPLTEVLSEFGGFSRASDPAGVATPVPPGVLLFLTGIAAIA
ncbi:MAG: hypothetical protein AAF511_11250, partial [Pseudomonadota bacterium]